MNADVRLLTRDYGWQQGVIENPNANVRITENDRPKLLQNVVRIHRNGRSISDRGDSGTLVFSTRDPTDPTGLIVYGMAVGKVDLLNGGSFTVANRLYDILPAIRNDPRNWELFRGYKELNLCGIVAEPDSGFDSMLAA